MELWIRSQEKSLGKVLFIRYAGLALDITYESGNITSEHFKSKERALEVLDEIQKYINNECEFLEREQHTSMGTYKNKEQMRVYEMPKD